MKIKYYACANCGNNLIRHRKLDIVSGQLKPGDLLSCDKCHGYTMFLRYVNEYEKWQEVGFAAARETLVSNASGALYSINWRELEEVKSYIK